MLHIVTEFDQAQSNLFSYSRNARRTAASLLADSALIHWDTALDQHHAGLISLLLVQYFTVKSKMPPTDISVRIRS